MSSFCLCLFSLNRVQCLPQLTSACCVSVPHLSCGVFVTALFVSTFKVYIPFIKPAHSIQLQIKTEMKLSAMSCGNQMYSGFIFLSYKNACKDVKMNYIFLLLECKY